MKKKEALKNLSKEAKEWWRKILMEYDISDEAGYLILQTSLQGLMVTTEQKTFSDLT